MNRKQIVDKIALFYERTNRELRSLEEFKRQHGICIAGISCMQPATPETRHLRTPMCEEHRKARAALRNGERQPFHWLYQTPYGKLRKQSRQSHLQKQKKPQAA